MKKNVMIAFVLGLAILNGCSAGQSVSEDNLMPAEEYSSENVYVQLQDETVSVPVYENEEFGIKISHLVNDPGNYTIICGDECQDFEIGCVPEDILDLVITPWGDDSLFLVCDLHLADDRHQYLIINKEILSEVMITDPKETAESRLGWEVTEKGGDLWLCINQVSTGISADSQKALEVLGHNIKLLDEFNFHSESDAFVCDVPLSIFEEEKTGSMRLYYEYDGVGMNCINAEFVPL